MDSDHSPLATWKTMVPHLTATKMCAPASHLPIIHALIGATEVPSESGEREREEFGRTEVKIYGYFCIVCDFPREF